jgi:hypothetical protein
LFTHGNIVNLASTAAHKGQPSSTPVGDCGSTASARVPSRRRSRRPSGCPRVRTSRSSTGCRRWASSERPRGLPRGSPTWHPTRHRT